MSPPCWTATAATAGKIVLYDAVVVTDHEHVTGLDPQERIGGIGGDHRPPPDDAVADGGDGTRRVVPAAPCDLPVRAEHRDQRDGVRPERRRSHRCGRRADHGRRDHRASPDPRRGSIGQLAS